MKFGIIGISIYKHATSVQRMEAIHYCCMIEVLAKLNFFNISEIAIIELPNKMVAHFYE